jgi:hypothetical protein
MSVFGHKKTTRYRAYVVLAYAREGDYSRETIYYIEAVDFRGACAGIQAHGGGRMFWADGFVET